MKHDIPELRNCCPRCRGPIGGPRNFRDAEARFEFYAKGLCQACQDKAEYAKLVRTVLVYTQPDGGWIGGRAAEPEVAPQARPTLERKTP